MSPREIQLIPAFCFAPICYYSRPFVLQPQPPWHGDIRRRSRTPQWPPIGIQGFCSRNECRLHLHNVYKHLKGRPGSGYGQDRAIYHSNSQFYVCVRTPPPYLGSLHFERRTYAVLRLTAMRDWNARYKISCGHCQIQCITLCDLSHRTLGGLFTRYVGGADA